MKLYVSDYIHVIAVGAITLLVVGLIYFIIQSTNNYAEWCQAQGGEVHTTSSVGTGVGANGQPTTVVTSNSMCLTEDGRIIR